MWLICVGVEMLEHRQRNIFRIVPKIYKYKIYWLHFNSFHSYRYWGNYYIMHKITVPPLQPLTYYVRQYHLTAIIDIFWNALLLFCTSYYLKILFSSSQSHILQNSGNNGFCESTGGWELESMPSPPVSYHTAHCMMLTAMDQYMSPCCKLTAIQVQIVAHGCTRPNTVRHRKA